MIAIVDYGMGNLRSVEKAFLKVGINAIITNNPTVVDNASAVVLPGVGAFRDCMRELTNLKLINAVVDAIKAGKHYLGICLGLQVLFSESEEFGRCKGLDIFKGKVIKFRSQKKGGAGLSSDLKVPHMGWNQITIQKNNPLLDGIADRTHFYFVHSFYVVPEEKSIITATTDYGFDFTSMIWKDNVFAVQFHPEKSQTAGLKLLENFGRIVNQ